MPEIKIKIRDKRAGGTGTVICGNSDYTVAWDLDQEWTPYDTKTMRVNLADGTYQDVVFAGDTAALPTLSALIVRVRCGKALSVRLMMEDAADMPNPDSFAQAGKMTVDSSDGALCVTLDFRKGGEIS